MSKFVKILARPVWIDHPAFDQPVLTSNPEIAARYPRLSEKEARQRKAEALAKALEKLEKANA